MTKKELLSAKTSMLRQHLTQSLQDYFLHLDGAHPKDLYNIVLTETEAPLLKAVMDYVAGNQTQAAVMLGLSRGTLRKKLRQHKLC